MKWYMGMMKRLWADGYRQCAACNALFKGIHVCTTFAPVKPEVLALNELAKKGLAELGVGVPSEYCMHCREETIHWMNGARCECKECGQTNTNEEQRRLFGE